MAIIWPVNLIPKNERGDREQADGPAPGIMKIKGARKDLLEALGNVYKILKPTTPSIVAQGIKITVTNDGVTAQTTDLEQSITQKMRAETLEPGVGIFPAKIFELIKRLDNDQIEIETVNNGTHAYIRAGKSETFVSCFDVKDFPVFPAPDKGTVFELPGSTLRDALSRVGYAVSDDQQRPAFTGVLFDLQKDKASLVATDTFRLSIHEIKNLPAESIQAIVPGIIAKIATPLFNSEKVFVTLSEKLIVLKDEGNETIITSRLIPGRYPQYRQVIPSGFVTSFKAKIPEMRKALERASLFLQGENKNITAQLKKEDGVLVITGGKDGSRHTEDIQVSILDGELHESIMLKGSFLQDVVAHMPGDEMVIKLTGQYTPVVFIPADESIDHLAIIVPARVA